MSCDTCIKRDVMLLHFLVWSLHHKASGDPSMLDPDGFIAKKGFLVTPWISGSKSLCYKITSLCDGYSINIHFHMKDSLYYFSLVRLEAAIYARQLVSEFLPVLIDLFLKKD